MRYSKAYKRWHVKTLEARDFDTVVCICVENHIGFEKAQETTNYLNSICSRMGGYLPNDATLPNANKYNENEILSSGCTAPVN